MKNLAMGMALLVMSASAAHVEVFPQVFDAGGWKLDVQFMDVMGLPYLPVPAAGRYRLLGRAPYSNWAKPGSVTTLELVSGKTVRSLTIDQAVNGGQWNEIGVFDLEPGATLRIVGAKSRGTVIADGFALVRSEALR